MSGSEGVVKFRIRFTPSAPLPRSRLHGVIAWRKILYLLKLIGQDPDRYEGFGYGNISRRLDSSGFSGGNALFAVSGTQTGGIPELREEHFAIVSYCDPESNLVVAEGPVTPSSEALTHWGLYAADDGIGAVMHVHSPEIWRQAARLGLRLTSGAAEYGSVEMAEAVGELIEDAEVRRKGIFAMGGHEDGIVSFGRNAHEAGVVLIKTLASAFERGSVSDQHSAIGRSI